MTRIDPSSSSQRTRTLSGHRSAWVGLARHYQPPAPTIAHILSLIAGFAALSYLNRHEWFYLDDWDFLALRGLHHPHFTIWFPHNEHWSTLPILLYRLVFTIGGLHTWWLLVGCLLVIHLVVAHLMWRTSIRVGVNPWMATALTTVFLLLGAGWQDLTAFFNLSFIAPVALGYVALVVNLRFGRLRRTVLTWLLTVAALACSGIGITMTVAVGIDVAFRHGIRRAALAMSVPLATYLIWYGLVGHKGLAIDHVTLDSLLQIPTFLWTGLSSALGTTFGLATAGPFLVLAIFGWALVNAKKAATVQGTVLALAIASVVLYVVIGAARSQLGAGFADTTRYVYVAMALLLPAIGLALTELIKWRRETRFGIYGLLLLILVSNVSSLHVGSQTQTALAQREKATILAAAAVVTDGDRPLAGAPDPELPVSSALLGNLSRRGKLPSIRLTSVELANAQFAVDVSLTSQPALAGQLMVTTPPPAGPGCATAATITVAVPGGGGSIIVSSPITQTAALSLRTAGGVLASPVTIPLVVGGNTLNASAPGTTLTLTTTDPRGLTICRAA